MAHSQSSLAMSPDGKFYNCLFGVGREVCSVGNLDVGYEPMNRLATYAYLDDTRCLRCELLESCRGGCRYDSYMETGSIEGIFCKKEALRRMRSILL
ncbi:hypothetical protein COY62_02385 [bacterium (Candidatus Howlettbacteria) CG_4_10_14_0_8_um_filter_40_9]|nr:MAG: hypothetical protein COY62_02385 [bacterium (Candidatus Howlettbacteria) CG_4_10_14_0_8_um_filter_40_9]